MKKILGILSGIVGFIIILGGIILKRKEAVSVSIIGGADGPTSVFLAGKVGNDFSEVGIVAGVVLVVVAMVFLFIKKR
ncbi:MAG: sodium ion-translocating decarboxylase subunit beta [Lachnospiraceae bacterium]|nr:sodium ion-translocating decarboxylase subunit beta [Lachnospiraceae bacterium]